MKLLVASAALFLFIVTSPAQTFVRYSITNLIQVTANYYSNSVAFQVPSNTLAKLTKQNDGFSDSFVTVVYPESPVKITAENTDGGVTKVLGPATVYFEADNGVYSSAACSVSCIAEFTPVNVAPAVTGFAVQPANSTAQIGLETSTDLKTWKTTAPGNYGNTNAARFFRMNLSVTP